MPGRACAATARWDKMMRMGLKMDKRVSRARSSEHGPLHLVTSDEAYSRGPLLHRRCEIVHRGNKGGRSTASGGRPLAEPQVLGQINRLTIVVEDVTNSGAIKPDKGIMCVKCHMEYIFKYAMIPCGDIFYGDGRRRRALPQVPPSNHAAEGRAGAGRPHASAEFLPITAARREQSVVTTIKNGRKSSTRSMNTISRYGPAAPRHRPLRRASPRRDYPRFRHGSRGTLRVRYIHPLYSSIRAGYTQRQGRSPRAPRASLRRRRRVTARSLSAEPRNGKNRRTPPTMYLLN
ncbi:hypothetical protein EVAR_21361_1 [Eumeta japonica]|uniref:Uncharacterized protein n=1 Tax=Eumeta variegata TaxID=151549 RepID=A0A4C1YGD9_EUMVA|nr:hypothetical protein EVAR_21361_1 [Eumeta japonica]